MNQILTIGEQKVTSEDVLPLLTKYQMLPQLLREVIIDQEVSTIECTPEELNLARQQLYQQQQITTEEQLKAWLHQQFMTLEQVENLIARKIKLEKFKQTTWGDQVNSYFFKRKSQLDRVIYSLIRTQDIEMGQELYFRIEEKENTFEELARQYSQGAEAQTGGLIGPVELSVPHPQIAQLLAVSQPGKVIPPTRIGDWVVILRLEKFITAQLDPPMQQRLLEELFRTWLQEEVQKKVSFSG
jgi:parvulin-like peptidyl-prolyl isomerase